MTVDEGGEKSLIVPLVRYGNVVLMPQPARGWGEDLDKLYHAQDLTPPHQYVAAYRGWEESFDADAIVHIGTHGTLEWLDGKDVGRPEEDASDAQLGALPGLYGHTVDVAGPGLDARRRG